MCEVLTIVLFLGLPSCEHMSVDDLVSMSSEGMLRGIYYINTIDLCQTFYATQSMLVLNRSVNCPANPIYTVVSSGHT